MNNNYVSILEFMGFTYEKNLGWFDNENSLDGMFLPTTDNTFDDSDLEYDKDWNLLMSVVHKIEDMGYEVLIGRISCNINHQLHRESPIVGWVCGNINAKIELVYTAVLQFIEWHKSNK